jgi:hypothetical protein
MSEPRRSRRAKVQVASYSKEQVFSDEDLFEDSSEEQPTPSQNRTPKRAPSTKRGRPKGSSSRKSTGTREPSMAVDEEIDGSIYRANEPIYTEKGYDPNLAPIPERFPFLPEYEPDGSPRIDLIVGRRPLDEKEADDGNTGNDDGSDNDNQDPTEDEDEDDSDDGGDRKKRGRGKRGANKKSSPKKKKNDSSTLVEYEYLVKYKGRSYLHLEWKTGADLESMNKSAKTLYRRFIKKVAQGLDEDIENPDFDASYAVPQKICTQREQELTLELSDKELLEWEKEREEELAEEDSDDEPGAEGAANGGGEDDDKKKENVDESKDDKADDKREEEKKGKLLILFV